MGPRHPPPLASGWPPCGSGRPPRNEGSCVIHLEGRFAGWGFDYATGESAGPIDMVYHGTGTSGAALFEEAARWARMDRPAPPPRSVPPKPDHSLEIARILAGCQPLAGTAAETYLQRRAAASALLRATSASIRCGST
ncbi:MAG: hypothetical protein WAS73_01350 [Defluviicoccus sp.]